MRVCSRRVERQPQKQWAPDDSYEPRRIEKVDFKVQVCPYTLGWEQHFSMTTPPGPNEKESFPEMTPGEGETNGGAKVTSTISRGSIIETVRTFLGPKPRVALEPLAVGVNQADERDGRLR